MEEGFGGINASSPDLPNVQHLATSPGVCIHLDIKEAWKPRSRELLLCISRSVSWTRKQDGKCHQVKLEGEKEDGLVPTQGHHNLVHEKDAHIVENVPQAFLKIQ